MGHEVKPGPWASEIGRAAAERDGVQIDTILIDQAKLGEAVGQIGAGNLDLSLALGLQRTNRALEIVADQRRSEEHTSELQSLMRISYAVFCLKNKKKQTSKRNKHTQSYTKTIIYEDTT